MKKLALIALTFGLIGQFKAQEISKEITEDRTVFQGIKSFGGFIGLTAKTGDINGQSALLVGGELSAVFSSQLNIGFAGYGLTTNVESDSYDEDGKKYNIHMGYGGLLIEPVIASKRMIHFTVPMVFGVGGAGTHRSFQHPHEFEDVQDEDRIEYRQFETDVILVAEPGLNMEINLLKNVRLDIGASYRYVYDSQIEQISDQELSGFTGNVSLKLGWF